MVTLLLTWMSNPEDFISLEDALRQLEKMSKNKIGSVCDATGAAGRFTIAHTVSLYKATRHTDQTPGR